jgi:hypothetical protein
LRRDISLNLAERDVEAHKKSKAKQNKEKKPKGLEWGTDCEIVGLVG